MSSMKSKHLRIWIASSSLGLIGTVWPAGTGAQAPAGPLPAATPPPTSSADARAPAPVEAGKPRSSAFGSWTLNRDESDAPRKKMQDARGAGGGRGGGG